MTLIINVFFEFNNALFHLNTFAAEILNLKTANYTGVINVEPKACIFKKENGTSL